jgi:hypothetical protein
MSAKKVKRASGPRGPRLPRLKEERLQEEHFQEETSTSAAPTPQGPAPMPQPQATAQKQIIILARQTETSYQVVLWARPPAARVMYWASVAPGGSVYPGATQPEQHAITAGEVVEKVVTVTGVATLVELYAAAELLWVDFNTYVQTYNPWSSYGSYWDGTAWVPQGLP